MKSHWSSFPKVSPSPEGLNRLGFVLQWPQVHQYLHVEWGPFYTVSGHWCYIIPPLIQQPTSVTAMTTNNTLTCASGILAHTCSTWAREPCMMCLTSGWAFPNIQPPQVGEIPLDQSSQGLSITRGPDQVGFRPRVAPSTSVHACLMGGPSIKSQGIGVK